jgi:hypothetical protein
MSGFADDIDGDCYYFLVWLTWNLKLVTLLMHPIYDET